MHKVDSVAPFKTTLYDIVEGNHSLSIVAEANSQYQDLVQVSVASISGAGPNLISNSGFETSSIDGNIGSFGSVISLSNAQAASGGQSLFVNRTNSGSWRGVKYDLIDLEEGETYEFSAQVYFEENSSKISLTTKKTSTNYYTWPAEISNPQSGTWLEISAQITYDSELMDFIYIAGVDVGVDFYVDDISISKIGGAYSESRRHGFRRHVGLMGAAVFNSFRAIRHNGITA